MYPYVAIVWIPWMHQGPGETERMAVWAREVSPLAEGTTVAAWDDDPGQLRLDQ